MGVSVSFYLFVKTIVNNEIVVETKISNNFINFKVSYLGDLT